MKRILPALWLTLMLSVCVVGAGGLLTSCGVMSALGNAARDSSQLEQRYSELDEKLDLAQKAIEAYGPLAEDLGPEIKEKYEQILEQYGKVQGYVSEGKELLGEAMSLHERSMEQARDPDSGEVDWMQYALLMLAGGGGLYSERRRTKKEQQADRERLHSRLDKRKNEVGALQEQLRQFQHMMEMEKARREGASSGPAA